MISLIADLAKLYIRMKTPTRYDLIKREKQLLEEFNREMRSKLGEGWKLELSKNQYTEVKPQKEVEDPFDKVRKAMNLLKEARDSATCPVVRDAIDELLLTMEERLANRIQTSTGRKLLSEITRIVEEEGIEDWNELDESEKSRILNKIKSRLR